VSAIDQPATDFAEADASMQRFVESPDGPLGMAYGIVQDGRLVHDKGFGRMSLGGSKPSSDSVFRIASVSKSFTAAAILLLRDSGRLSLTDQVSEHLPSLARIDGIGTGDRRFSIASCLTMSAGLPTDDPWADRQESMSSRAFDEMLQAGIRLVRDPDTGFEYSNLGYAILGRVVETVSGQSFQSFVEDHLLRPLGLVDTTYDYQKVPEEKLVRGYRRRLGSWVEQPFSAPGAFSSIGGLLSSVTDLSRWVVGMLDAFGEEDPEASRHPLTREARREMQQARRAIPPEIRFDASGRLADIRTEGFAWGLSGYGFGLFVEDDPRWGQMVHHVGGYPGFSAHVRWHPGSGCGIIALTNRRYAPVWVPAADALKAILASVQAPARRMTLWPEVVEARSRIEDIMLLEDAAVIAECFEPTSRQSEEQEPAGMSANVCEDIPATERAEEVLEIQRRVGTLRVGRILDVESDSPAHLAWWQEAAHGCLRGEIRLTPTKVPLIQTVALKGVPSPTGFLAEVLKSLGQALADEDCRWPDDIPLAEGADAEVLAETLRTARRSLGRCRIGWPVDGALPSWVSVQIVGQGGRATLLVTSTPSGTALAGLSITLLPVSARANTVVEPPLPTPTTPA
jgi:CubicO group peptidase (beta-lactamase class C family)